MTESAGESPLRAVNLRKTFRSGWRLQPVEALREVSLDVERGAVFGLLGPNGAGKTTFIKVLLGILRPTGGTARIFGRSASDASSRRSVGYLPETLHFPEHLSALAVLDVMARMSGLSAADRKSSIERQLSAVGLAEWGHHRVGTFSKGMRRRLGIAQALLGDPELVILDEPTDGVDPVGRPLIRRLIQDLQRRGTTVFLNSHLLSEVESVCSRIGVLDRGRIRWEGTVAELTRVDDAVDLELSGIEDPAPFGLTPLPAAPGAPGRYRLHAASQVEIDGAVRRLLDAGISVRRLEPARRTFEQAFVELVAAHE